MSRSSLLFFLSISLSVALAVTCGLLASDLPASLETAFVDEQRGDGEDSGARKPQRKKRSSEKDDDREDDEKLERKKASRKKEASDDAPRPPIDPKAPWRLPKTGYRQLLEKIETQKEEVLGFEAKLTVVPDAYTWYMARGMEELVRARYDGKELAKRLKALHRKHKKQRGKVLFLLDLEPRGKAQHAFLTGRAKSHFAVRSGKRKVSLSEVAVEPKPRFASWQIFEYPPNAKRKVYRKKLCEFRKMHMELITSSIKASQQEPIDFVVQRVLGGKQQKDPRDSVHVKLRQIAATELRQNYFEPIRFQIYPKRWKMPEPPEAFRETLERLNR